MSWLRLDDGFDTHPKVLELSEAHRWRWVELLLACARHGREGEVSGAMLRRVGLERGRLLSLGLLDEAQDGGLSVHDWADYNPADNARALKQKRYRMRRAGVSEDEIMRVAPPLPGPERYVTRDVTEDVTRDPSSYPTAGPNPAQARPVPNHHPTVVSSTSERGDTRETHRMASQLLALLDADELAADYILGAADALPGDVVAGLLAHVGAGLVPDPLAHVLDVLRSELQRVEV